MEITEQPQSTPPLVIGNTTSVTCTAQSIPRPFITWYKIQNGEELQLAHGTNGVSITEEQGNKERVSRSTLNLTLISESDFTSYFCRGKNDFSTTDSNLANITRASEYSISYQVNVLHT